MVEWTTDVDACLGQIIKIGGKNYRVTKVTRTALAVERYYFFDAAYDWMVRKVSNWRVFG